jgi:hypothetical protein
MQFNSETLFWQNAESDFGRFTKKKRIGLASCSGQGTLRVALNQHCGFSNKKFLSRIKQITTM